MYRILVVDDERIERNGIKMLLKRFFSKEMQMEIFEAANGKAALEFLEKQPIDILITDVKMPFMDGIELIQTVAPKRREMKIAIFSGYSEFEYAKIAMQYGVKNYILKPVDPKEFQNTILSMTEELEKENEVIRHDYDTRDYDKHDKNSKYEKNGKHMKKKKESIFGEIFDMFGD